MQTEKTIMLQEVAMQPAFVRANIAPMLAAMRQVPGAGARRGRCGTGS